MSVQCNECGSSQVIATAENFVCSNCGLVFEDMPVISDAPSFYSVKNTFVPQISHSPNAKLGTLVGNKSEITPKFKKIHQLQRQLNHIPATAAFHELSMIKARFNITVPAEHYVDVFNHVFSIIPKKTAGRNIRKLCGIIFYKFSLSRHVKIALTPILQYAEFTRREYSKILKAILIHLPLTSPYRKIFQRSSKEDYYRDLGYALWQFYIIKPMPMHIVKLSKKLLMHHGRNFGSKISIKASTAITLALQHYGIPDVKTYKIAEILGCAASTIYKRADLVRSTINFERLISPGTVSRPTPMAHTMTKNVITLNPAASPFSRRPAIYAQMSSILPQKVSKSRRKFSVGHIHLQKSFHVFNGVFTSQGIFPHERFSHSTSPSQLSDQVSTFSGEHSFSPPQGSDFSPPIS